MVNCISMNMVAGLLKQVKCNNILLHSYQIQIIHINSIEFANGQDLDSGLYRKYINYPSLGCKIC